MNLKDYKKPTAHSNLKDEKPKMPKRETKTETIVIKLSKTEKQRLKQNAKDSGIKMLSTFVREVLAMHNYI